MSIALRCVLSPYLVFDCLYSGLSLSVARAHVCVRVCARVCVCVCVCVCVRARARARVCVYKRERERERGGGGAGGQGDGYVPQSLWDCLKKKSFLNNCFAMKHTMYEQASKQIRNLNNQSRLVIYC